MDGAVDQEKLDELLAVGTELTVLDYKRTLDLSKGVEKDRVELVKDIAGFSTLPSGGYIVIGVDGHGRVETELANPNPAHFDEATLRQIAASYMDGKIALTSKAHTLAGGRVVVVLYVAAALDGLPPVMTREGSYKAAEGPPRSVFRRGDVFRRVGTSVERITHDGWGDVLAGYRQLVRGQVAADTQEVIARVAAALREDGALGAGGKPAVIDLGMSASDFEEAIDAALTAGNVAAVRRALRPVRGVLSTVWSDTPSEDVAETLDRVTSVAAIALLQRNMDAYELAFEVLYRSYTDGLASPSTTEAKYGHRLAVTTFWRDVAARVLGLLALAIREQAWSFMRPAVLRPIGGDWVYLSWLRHGITEAARAGVLVSAETGKPSRGAVIRFARQAVAGVPALHEDVPFELVTQGFDETPPDQDALLDSLCQADWAWCVIASVASGAEDDTKEFYPSCGAFFDHRVYPFAVLMTRDEPMRREVAGGPDGTVAASLVIVNRAASSEAGGWRPWSVIHGPVQAFVQAHTHA